MSVTHDSIASVQPNSGRQVDEPGPRLRFVRGAAQDERRDNFRPSPIRNTQATASLDLRDQQPLLRNQPPEVPPREIPHANEPSAARTHNNSAPILLICMYTAAHQRTTLETGYAGVQWMPSDMYDACVGQRQMDQSYKPEIPRKLVRNTLGIGSRPSDATYAAPRWRSSGSLNSQNPVGIG